MHSECALKASMTPFENGVTVPKADGKCHCQATFDLKKEKAMQNTLLNFINQYYDTQVWQMGGEVEEEFVEIKGLRAIDKRSQSSVYGTSSKRKTEIMDSANK